MTSPLQVKILPVVNSTTTTTTMPSRQKTPATRYQRLPSAEGVLPIADTPAAAPPPPATTNPHSTVAFVGPHRDAAPQQPLLSTSPPKPTTSYNTFAQPASNTAATASTSVQASNTQTRLTKPKQPNRTTKISQKLTLFPQDDNDTATPFLAGLAGVSGIDASKTGDDEVYNQIAQIPHGTARLEAERLNKLNRSKLPRVTAYCTASSYRMDDLVKYLQYRKTANGAAPKRFDECIYTPYSFMFPLKPPGPHQRSSFSHASASSSSPPTDVPGSEIDSITKPSMGDETDQEEHLPEVFFFDYGVIVIWGMTEEDERKMRKEMTKFEEEKLDDDDVETEEFHFHYNSSYQPRIYNDVITLKSAANYLVKLTISHAIAQSVKMTLFERLIEDTISDMKHIPQDMAETGKVHLSRTAITQKIGQLFIMRININLVSNILDTPEIFWSEPALEPLYSAIRGYLEISQRVEVLNQRVAVISDLLDMLKEHQISSHGEQLEWIVIVLIGFEIVIGLITIALDAFSYSHRR